MVYKQILIVLKYFKEIIINGGIRLFMHIYLLQAQENCTVQVQRLTQLKWMKSVA